MKNYLLSIAILIGTIIGVGMFAMPFVINKSGILSLFIYMPVLGFIQYYLHLLFAEAVLSIKGSHRLPGYAEKCFGATSKKIILVFNMLCDYGTILAYIILGGIFLHQLLNPIWGGSIFFYSTILFTIQALIVLFGIKTIAAAEFLMTGLLLVAIMLISWRGWNFINPANYTLVNWNNFLLPYGPVFFAVSGYAAIPEICKLLAHNKEKIKSAIAWGTFISVLMMAVFVYVIVGVTGENTSPDTLSGLKNIFGGGVMTFAFILGLLAVVTSFLTISQSLREVFWWDFKINKNLAWFLALSVPYLLYFFGLRNLTTVVSLTGAVASSLLGISMTLIVLKIKKKRDRISCIKNYINRPIVFVLCLMFVLGLIYEIWSVTK